MPLVRATESGIGQTEWLQAIAIRCGVLEFHMLPFWSSRSSLERDTKEGDSPVDVSQGGSGTSRVLGVEIPQGIWESVTSNSKYSPSPIAKKYRKGTLKSTQKWG